MITDVADSLAYDVPGDNSVKISEDRVPLIPFIETAHTVFLWNESIIGVVQNFERISHMQINCQSVTQLYLERWLQNVAKVGTWRQTHTHTPSLYQFLPSNDPAKPTEKEQGEEEEEENGEGEVEKERSTAKEH